MRRFRESFQPVESPVPLPRQLGHRPGGFIEAIGFNVEENLAALFAAADQSSVLEDDEMLGDRLPGERDPAGHSARTRLTAPDEMVENPAPRRIGDSRPQVVVGLRPHRF
jgi:hypothetical protein